MKKDAKLTKEEISELEALEIRGGVRGSGINPLSNDPCLNGSAGCGCGSTNSGCTNSVSGCGCEPSTNTPSHCSIIVNKCSNGSCGSNGLSCTILDD